MIKRVSVWFIAFLFLWGSHSLWAQTPPLVRTLPSGSKIIFSSVPEASYVSVQILIDTRAYQGDVLKQIYIRAYLLNLEQELNALQGITRLYPMQPIPESVYDPRVDQYLDFTISAQSFDKNIETILNIFCGKLAAWHFTIGKRRHIFMKSFLVNTNLTSDSLKKIMDSIKFKELKNFINSVSLRKNMYLYIAGNFNQFRTVSSAIHLAKYSKAESGKEESRNAINPMDWYWTFVFRQFTLDMMKRLLNNSKGEFPLRLFATLPAKRQPIRIRFMRGYRYVPLSDSLKRQVKQFFTNNFRDWYQNKFFYDLKWRFKDVELTGLLRLLSLARCGQPDVLFLMDVKPNWEQLKSKFDLFLTGLKFNGTEKQ